MLGVWYGSLISTGCWSRIGALMLEKYLYCTAHPKYCLLFKRWSGISYSPRPWANGTLSSFFVRVYKEKENDMYNTPCNGSSLSTVQASELSKIPMVAHSLFFLYKGHTFLSAYCASLTTADIKISSHWHCCHPKKKKKKRSTGVRGLWPLDPAESCL